MRYLIKERIFSFADRFTINDESNRPQYEVVGKIFAIGNKLNFYDIRGKHILYIEQKIFRLLPEYSIYDLTHISESKVNMLKDLNVSRIIDIPESMKLTEKQKVQVKATKENRVIFSQEQILDD